MDIKQWFDAKGSYEQGVQLYAQLPNCDKRLLRSFDRENTANFLKLKYELKLALENGRGATVPVKANNAPQPEKKPIAKPQFKEVLIKESEAVAFHKETMAMYPAELHGVYRSRISDFYAACELKFKLNALEPDAEQEALAIILELEELWDKIDRAWDILHHWRDHKRIMPVAQSEDFTKMSPMQLVKRRANLETSISKRSKTLVKLEAEAQQSPEDRNKLNMLNKKKEELQQLQIDLDTVRGLLLKEEEK